MTSSGGKALVRTMKKGGEHKKKSACQVNPP